jgi:hypothetical protein
MNNNQYTWYKDLNVNTSDLKVTVIIQKVIKKKKHKNIWEIDGNTESKQHETFIKGK